MKTFKILLVILMISILCEGCARFSSPDFMALAGLSIRDLENAKADGKTQTYQLPYNDAYDKIVDIIHKNSLEILRSNRKKGYIVTIGFSKQTSTTRVGIFFESIDENTTKITLSSMSTTALTKAESIFFGNIGNATIVE